MKVNWRNVMAVAIMSRRERATNCTHWPTDARLGNHLRSVEPRYVSR